MFHVKRPFSSWQEWREELEDNYDRYHYCNSHWPGSQPIGPASFAPTAGAILKWTACI